MMEMWLNAPDSYGFRPIKFASPNRQCRQPPLTLIHAQLIISSLNVLHQPVVGIQALLRAALYRLAGSATYVPDRL